MEYLIDLKSIGSRMATQDNRATQYPLFVIQVNHKNYVGYSGGWQEKERLDPDYVDQNLYCDACLEAAEEPDSDGIPEECISGTCDDDTFGYYRIEQKFDLEAGVFFTEAAADLHIRQNHYRYNKPRTYVISAWRNPEMVAIMQELIKNANHAVPSHYK